MGLCMTGFGIVNRMRSESPNGFNHKLSDWSLSDWFTATMGELGEAANVAKKLNRIRDGINGNKESEAELRAKLARELADVYIYLDLLCQSQGINLAAAVRETFNAKSDQIGCEIKV
jgi:NTP pyrophosphatase (non-canonical NTP hydrolase)